VSSISAYGTERRLVSPLALHSTSRSSTPTSRGRRWRARWRCPRARFLRFDVLGCPCARFLQMLPTCKHQCRHGEHPFQLVRRRQGGASILVGPTPAGEGPQPHKPLGGASNPTEGASNCSVSSRRDKDRSHGARDGRGSAAAKEAGRGWRGRPTPCRGS
jgi:hypothetical protein